MLKKYSVILPIYNVENFLRDCLDGILAYQGDNLEIIAVDDGSTDRSGAILDSYNDPRMKVFHKSNEGLYKTWKYGVQKSTGEYIVFVDSDDLVSSELFDCLNDLLADSDYDLIQYDWNEKYPKHEKRIHALDLPQGAYRGEELNLLLDTYVFFKTGATETLPLARWGKVFRAELFKSFLEHSMDDICMLEDCSVCIPYTSLIKSYYYLARNFYSYRIMRVGSINQTQTKIYSYYEDYENLVRYLIENRDIFSFSDQAIETYNFITEREILIRAVCAKAHDLADQILSDRAFVSKLGKDLRSKLLLHRKYATYRLLKKIRNLLTGRY